MPSIYSEAAITIIASRATGVHEGFLHDRIKEAAMLVPVEMRFRGRNGNEETVTLYLDDTTFHRHDEPLDSRAWALQERLIPSNILDYGAYQTTWTCKESKWIFSSTCSVSGDFADGLSFSQKDDWHNQYWAVLSDHQHGEMEEGGRALWRKLVSEYTSRKLTCPIDCLPAISGIANRLSHLFEGPEDHVAEMWRSDLLYDLLWNRFGDVLSRPSRYQGPSWSWTSINSQIDYSLPLFDYGLDRHHWAKIIECRNRSTGKEPSSADTTLGAIEPLQVTIEGRVRPVKWKRDEEPDCYVDSYGRHLVKSASGEDLGISFRYDAVEELPQDDSGYVHGILLVIVSDADAYGLVLRQENSEEYRRVGRFHVGKGPDDEKGWAVPRLEEGEMKIVTIF